MSTRQISKTSWMVSFAAEAGLGAAGGFFLCLHELHQWKAGAMLFTVALLLIQGLRAVRAMSLLDGLNRDIKRAFSGVLLSMLGWIAMIVIFTLMTLYPELEIPSWYLAPAVIAHMGGALWAMHALNTPDQM